MPDKAGNGHRRRSFKGEPAVALALATGSTIGEAAEAGGVSYKTVQRRISDPEYQARISQQRSEFLARAVGQLSAASTQAVETLVGLLQAKSEMARLGAAKAILEYGISLAENQDTQRRIATLEGLIFRRTDEIMLTREVTAIGP
jgi:hypothetical protein